MEKLKETFQMQENESTDAYIMRACAAGKDMRLKWQEIADLINGETGLNYSESKYRKDYHTYMMGVNDGKQCRQQTSAAPTEDKTPADTVAEQIREIQKEKLKVRTDKLEYNRWLRENARDELIMEHIIDEVRKLPTLEAPNFDATVYERHLRCDAKEAVLAFGDEHYGTEFKIYGLFGEVINEYSPEIFERRMAELLETVKRIIAKEGIEVLHVFSLGDCVDGVLRVSQLRKLRYGVVESSVRYADYISRWLNELSKVVLIKFQMVYGNHSELRMLGQPKGTFVDENTGLFVKEIIKTRLENNKNFIMEDNPTGLIFANVCGKDILGIHGEVKNMEQAIKNFSMTYNANIDILIGGHMHHYKSEGVGIDKDVWNVPSIIGVDSFAMSINKTSRPGAVFTVFDANTKIEYKIDLA